MRRVVVILLGIAILMIGCQVRPTVPDRPPRIAFMSDRNTNFDLYVMDRNGSNPTRLTNQSETNFGLPNWSAETQSLTYVTDQGGAGLRIGRMDAGGENAHLFENAPAPDGTPPVWSPTGEWIAFSGGADVQNVEVYLMDPAGEKVINLTDHPAQDQFAGWSADGQHLLFLSDRDEGLAIYSISINGGDPARLTELESANAEPSWSPDGSKITFMSNRDDDIEIYIMDSDGNNPARLTTSAEFDGYPKWSPDGSKIAFLSARDGNAEIYVMDANGDNQTNLTNSPNSQESVQGDFEWSPDGRQILFHSSNDGNVDVFVMNADGSHQKNITAAPSTDFGAVWVK